MEWQEIKELTTRQMDHATSRTDERIGKLRRTDGMMGQLFFVVEHDPEHSLFITLFRSEDIAIKTAERLSFAKGKGQKLGFGDNMFGKLFNAPESEGVACCMFILGGSLSAKQRLETFEAFEKHGKVTDLVLPPGVAPLERKKSGWKFWQK